MKLLLLCRYGRLGASSRLRSLQYVPYLKSKGWDVVIRPLFSDSYLQALYDGRSRMFKVVVSYLCRLYSLIQVKQYDVVWIEKEIFPFFPAVLERLLKRLGVRYVVDYDDALFHRYDNNKNRLIRHILGRKIDVVMKCSSLVVVGNKYLADRAMVANAKSVSIIPTVVDLTRYKRVRKVDDSPLVIGWMGSSSTSKYLLLISSVISMLKKDFNVRFVAVGACKKTIFGTQFESLAWTENSEVKSIQSFDIGIMPLDDTPWEQGKCGYKLIQYMACGIPVVASPVGVNQQIVKHGVNGFLAADVSQWEQMLRELLSNEKLRYSMGSKGRELVEAEYSLQIQAPRIEKLMSKVLS